MSSNRVTKRAQEASGTDQADGGQDVFGFGTAADGKWLFVRVTDPSLMESLAADHSEDWQSLGVSLLHKLLLEELLFKELGGTPQFEYVHRLEETAAAARTRRPISLDAWLPRLH